MYDTEFTEIVTGKDGRVGERWKESRSDAFLTESPVASLVPNAFSIAGFIKNNSSVMVGKKICGVELEQG